MPDWIGDQMAGVGFEAEFFVFMSSDRSLQWIEGERLFRVSTRVFGRNAQIPVMSGRRPPVVKGCFEAVVNVSSAVMSTAC
jgi:hypothetical protein